MKREPRLGPTVGRSGFLLVVPAMAITFPLGPHLPAAYDGVSFDRGIPAWLSAAENLLRIVVFGVPVLLRFGRRAPLQPLGWFLYGVGLMLYLGSYLGQILAPTSGWSTGMVGFTAPAWTPLIWLIGVGLVCTETWVGIAWNRAVYPLLAMAFVALHGAHAYLAYLQRPPG